MCSRMSLSASAQAGDKALGAQFVFGSQTNNIGFGVKGQYYVTDHLRGEASFDYFLKNKGISCGISMQMFTTSLM